MGELKFLLAVLFAAAGANGASVFNGQSIGGIAVALKKVLMVGLRARLI
jgi:hypothetical protein